MKTKDLVPRELFMAFEGENIAIPQHWDYLLAVAFPTVKRQRQYHLMDAWLEANPKKQPRKRVLRFVYSWFWKAEQVEPEIHLGQGPEGNQIKPEVMERIKRRFKKDGI